MHPPQGHAVERTALARPSRHEQQVGGELSSHARRLEAGALHVDARVDAPVDDKRVVAISQPSFTPTAVGLLMR